MEIEVPGGWGPPPSAFQGTGCGRSRCLRDGGEMGTYIVVCSHQTQKQQLVFGASDDADSGRQQQHCGDDDDHGSRCHESIVDRLILSLHAHHPHTDHQHQQPDDLYTNCKYTGTTVASGSDTDISPNFTWLVTSRLDTTRSTCRARRVERVEPCCLTSSTQSKCKCSTYRKCRVET